MKALKLLSASFLCLVIGCAPGTGGGGTGTGNPGLRILSRGYNTPVARNSVLEFAVPTAVASTSTLLSLKFCVTELRFRTTGGSQINIPKTQLGFIDLGDGSQTITWGNLTQAPQGAVISKVEVQIEKDTEYCPGVNYSVSANGQTITKGIEFKFALTTPYTVGPSGSVTFTLTTLASKIDQALQDGKFDNGHIEDYLDGSFEDSAEGDDD